MPPRPKAFRNLALSGKVESYLPKYGRGADGSPGRDIDLPGRGRDRQPVGCGAAVENAAGNGQPQGLRARVSSADEAVQPVEPEAGADRCWQLLFCRVQAHSG